MTGPRTKASWSHGIRPLADEELVEGGRPARCQVRRCGRLASFRVTFTHFASERRVATKRRQLDYCLTHAARFADRFEVKLPPRWVLDAGKREEADQ